MVAVTCWALLLLTTLQTIAGRQLAAGPPASSMQMNSAPRMQHHVPGLPAAASRRLGRRAGALGGVVLGDGSHFKGRSPPPDDSMVPRSSDFQQVKKRRGLDLKKDFIYGGHRLLVGSSPPTCQGKCGSCYPCSPIHISLGSPHGALTQQEYYPEVWRCKCGSRYFMP